MHYSNLISTSISQKEIDEILAAIERINKLLPHLITLSNEEKASLPKVSFSNIDFVNEVLDMAEDNPEQVPESINIREIRKDIELIESITKILRPLKQLEKKLEDSALLAGSEAYIPSLAIFNSVRMRNREYKPQRITVS
jgi:hypothetical protein